MTELVAVGLGVVALVAEQGFWSSAGSAGAARDGWDAVDQGEGLGDVVDVGRSSDDLELGAASVADQVVFAARLPPVDRRRTGAGSLFFRADVGAVHARPRPVELAGRVQLGEQDPVQPVENPCLLPPVQPPPAGLSRAEPQHERQQLPGYVVVEDEQDALQAEPVPHRPRSRRPIRATAAATARSTPTTHRPRSTVEYPHPHERPNRHTGYAQPAHINKSLIRALGPVFPGRHPRGEVLDAADERLKPE